MASPNEEEAWSDKYLVERCLAGDKWAWVELDHRYRGRLETFAYTVLRKESVKDRNGAAELVENVLESLWERNCRWLLAWNPEKRQLLTHLIYFVRRALFAFLERREKLRRRETVLASQVLEKEAQRHPLTTSGADEHITLSDLPLPELTPAERRLLEWQFNHPGEVPPFYTFKTYQSMMSRIKKKFPSVQAPEAPQE